MKTYTLHVSGTHCSSCKILIEDILKEQADIKNPHVNLNQRTVSFETTSSDNEQQLAERLTKEVLSSGYSITVEKTIKTNDDNGTIWIALPIGLAFLIAFILLQKSGLLYFGIGGSVTPLTSFVIGLVASVSSCLAVVGGLVLSLSATVSKDAVSDAKPMWLFHSGRIIGFLILGGLLGLLGSAIGVSPAFGTTLGVLASVVMIVLGLNLVGIFNRSTITLPPHLFNFFRQIEHRTLAPFLLGIGTFFLPCGFTQTMQVAALSSGTFISGSLIMFAFALGTLPMLALLSFGSASFAHSKHAPLFFKTTGIVVLGLGTLALLAGLASLGIIEPLFSL